MKLTSQKQLSRPMKVIKSFLVMPFGLIDALSTFQGLMNTIFKLLLRRIVLVFFYDILVYCTTWLEHITHLKEVFILLRQYQLFVKKSKCSFGIDKWST